MITPEEFFGGAVDLGVMSANYTVTSFLRHRVLRVASVSSNQVYLPLNPPIGGPLMYIVNEDLGSDLVVYAGAVPIVNDTVYADSAAVVFFDGTSYYLKSLAIA